MEICKIDKKIIGWKVSKTIEKQTEQSNRPTSIIPVLSPKRPNELPCEIHQTSVKGKKWMVLIGLLKNDPYEIFTGYSENLLIPSKYTKGKIVKSGKSQYSLHIDVGEEELIIKDIVKTFDNPESAWATRIISTALRHGTPIDFIIQQLDKTGLISDINKAISRVLKKYIKEGTKVRTSVMCSQCSSEELVYSEGCMKCLSCGYSKCG